MRRWSAVVRLVIECTNAALPSCRRGRQGGDSRLTYRNAQLLPHFAEASHLGAHRHPTHIPEVELVGALESRGHRLLQGRHRAVRGPHVRHVHVPDQVRVADKPSDPPPGRIEPLACGPDHEHRSLHCWLHADQVGRRSITQAVIHAVANDQDSVAETESCYGPQLLLRKHLPGRILRRVHYHHLWPALHGTLEAVRVNPPLACGSPAIAFVALRVREDLDIEWATSCHLDGINVLIERWFKDDDLVSRFQEGHAGAQYAFVGPGCDGHFRLRIDLPVELLAICFCDRNS